MVTQHAHTSLFLLPARRITVIYQLVVDLSRHIQTHPENAEITIRVPGTAD